MKPGKSHKIRDIWIVANSIHKSLGIWHRITAQRELVNMGKWKGVMKCPKEKPGQEVSRSAARLTARDKYEWKVIWSSEGAPSSILGTTLTISELGPPAKSLTVTQFHGLILRSLSVSRRNSYRPGDLVSIGCSFSSSDINPNLPSKSLI